MNLGAILLDDKTRISISIATLLFVIGFSITATFTFTTWKTEFQMNQESFGKEQSRLQQAIEEETKVREQSDIVIMNEVKTNELFLQENKTQLTDMNLEFSTGLAKINESLAWIITDRRENK